MPPGMPGQLAPIRLVAGAANEPSQEGFEDLLAEPVFLYGGLADLLKKDEENIMWSGKAVMSGGVEANQESTILNYIKDNVKRCISFKELKELFFTAYNDMDTYRPDNSLVSDKARNTMLSPLRDIKFLVNTLEETFDRKLTATLEQMRDFINESEGATIRFDGQDIYVSFKSLDVLGIRERVNQICDTSIAILKK